MKYFVAPNSFNISITLFLELIISLIVFETKNMEEIVIMIKTMKLINVNPEVFCSIRSRFFSGNLISLTPDIVDMLCLILFILSVVLYSSYRFIFKEGGRGLYSYISSISLPNCSSKIFAASSFETKVMLLTPPMVLILSFRTDISSGLISSVRNTSISTLSLIDLIILFEFIENITNMASNVNEIEIVNVEAIADNFAELNPLKDSFIKYRVFNSYLIVSQPCLLKFLKIIYPENKPIARNIDPDK